jgi:tRNA A-37 threonylcarbamoyl transferase component Bud32
MGVWGVSNRSRQADIILRLDYDRIVGQRFGRYELLHPLGHGGMAEVFLARYSGPEGFEKRLVIKRVLPRLARDRRFLQMFFEEARNHVSLSHGNLVPVFDFGRVGNAYFIAMEYVPGRDLATLLDAARRRGERLPERLIAYLGAEVCRGLDYVHRRGLVHRDVAPRNVLLSVDGEVKLSDFGVALVSGDGRDARVRGTVAYMAPEQARGERPDGRADLYALGVVLAEAVLGTRVRPPSDSAEGLRLAREAGPVEVPGALGPIIARACAPDPAQRFTDAEQMLHALETIATQLGGGASAARVLAQTLVTLCGDQPALAEDAGVAATAAPERTETASDDALPPGRAVRAPATAHRSAQETYFRDRKSDATFADEVLAANAGAVAGKRRRAFVWLGAMGGAAAVFAGWLLARAPSVSAPSRPVPADVPAANAVPVPAAAPVTSAAPVPTAASEARAGAPRAASPASSKPAGAAGAPTVAKAPSMRVAGRPSGAVVGTNTVSATVVIRCTPWCEPFVDGRSRGADGRRHTLALPVGHHRVTAQRLEDRQEREIDLKAGETPTMDVTFE